MSDTTFDQQNGNQDKVVNGEKGLERVDDILTIGDITNVADHIVSTRKNSPIKKIQPNPRPKPTKSKPSKARRSKTNAKGSGKVTNPIVKQKPVRKPTAFDGFKPILDAPKGKGSEAILPLKIEKQHTSLDPGDLPFIDSKSTIPSIQLSEFQQPPKSASTPFNNSLIESYNDNPISRSTPLDQRPLGYSTPLFHFTPQDVSPDNTGSGLQECSSSLSRLLSNESPLASKNQFDSLRDDIHKITDRIKNNVSLKNTSSDSEYYPRGDISIKDVSYDLSEADDNMKTPSGSSGSSETQIPSKSILKIPGSSSSFSDRPKKSVKINETAYVNPIPLKNLHRRKKKRRATDDLALRSSKKVKLLHKVDSNTSYSDLLALCGEEKDPIDLILH